MAKYLRKDEIFSYISRKGVSSVSELMSNFLVSLSTLHRDLNELQREGRIFKYYGKVAVKIEQNFFNSRQNINVELKKRIAKKALMYIEEGDCIFFDNSTTVYYLAEMLCESMLKKIVVISNSATISKIFVQNQNINFVSTGGILNKDLQCYVGSHALNVIKDFNANKFFFSCSGISLRGGVSDIYMPDEYSIKKRMYEKSEVSFLLVDSTKYNKTFVTRWFNSGEINYIITDSNISDLSIRQFESFGGQLVVA